MSNQPFDIELPHLIAHIHNEDGAATLCGADIPPANTNPLVEVELCQDCHKVARLQTP